MAAKQDQSSTDPTKVVKKHRWYLGGCASAMAAACTHPLDLIKVHLQTQQEAKMNMSQMAVHVVKKEGIRGLYNGLTASLTRQMTYSTTRFGLYEILSGKAREARNETGPLPFYQKISIGMISGFAGGVVGNPADMVNVRMQNDMKIPVDQRRNYKHIFDGLRRVVVEEGIATWMKGVTMTSSRAVLMTASQVACYDQAKQILLQTGFFGDNMVTHFTASFIAGTIATAVTQPTDVMKTRMMNSAAGQYRNVFHCFIVTAKLGPMGFYKGFIPAWIRLSPQTILTWIFLEQLRLFFPYKS